MSYFFQEILAWRFAGAACWSLAILIIAEFIIAVSLSALSSPGAFDMFGIRGVLLFGLQLAVQVGG